jgi:hypothetical protein
LWSIYTDCVVGDKFALLLGGGHAVEVGDAQLDGVGGSFGLDTPGEQCLRCWHINGKILDFFLEVYCVDLAIGNFIELHHTFNTLLFRSLISWK